MKAVQKHLTSIIAVPNIPLSFQSRTAQCVYNSLPGPVGQQPNFTCSSFSIRPNCSTPKHRQEARFDESHGHIPSMLLGPTVARYGVGFWCKGMPEVDSNHWA